MRASSPIKKKKNYLAWIPALAALLLYSNTLNHAYTVDDETVITGNEIVKKGITAIPEIFSTAYWYGFNKSEDAVYRPLSLAMFAAEWQVAPGNPALGHFINVLLYAITAFLLFHILLLLFRENVLPALTVALLWVAHPLHTEVVANIKSRDEILCFLFFLLSFKFLSSYLHTGKISGLLVSLFCFLLSILSKETALTFLFLYPLIAWMFLETPAKRTFLIASVYLFVCFVYFGIRSHVLNNFSFEGEMAPINNTLMAAPDIYSRYATAFSILGRYLLLLVFPHPLSYDYSYAQIPVTGWDSFSATASLVLCAGILAAGILLTIRKSIYGFAILFFFITISITSNLFIIIGSTMAERFLYIPSLGFCIAAGVMAGNIKKGANLGAALRIQPLRALSFLLVILLFSGKTISRNHDWKDNFTLYTKDVLSSPNSARTHFDLGQELAGMSMMANKAEKNRLLDSAAAHLAKAAAIYPSYEQAYRELAKVYGMTGNYSRAIDVLSAVEKINPDPGAIYYSDLAYLYLLSGDTVKCVKMNIRALKINPGLEQCYSDLRICAHSEKVREEIKTFLEVSELKNPHGKAKELLKELAGNR